MQSHWVLHCDGIQPIHWNWFLTFSRFAKQGKILIFSPTAMQAANSDRVQMGHPGHGWSIWTISVWAACMVAGGNEGKHVSGGEDVSLHFPLPPCMLLVPMESRSINHDLADPSTPHWSRQSVWDQWREMFSLPPPPPVVGFSLQTGS